MVASPSQTAAVFAKLALHYKINTPLTQRGLVTSAFRDLISSPSTSSNQTAVQLLTGRPVTFFPAGTDFGMGTSSEKPSSRKNSKPRKSSGTGTSLPIKSKSK